MPRVANMFLTDQDIDLHVGLVDEIEHFLQHLHDCTTPTPTQCTNMTTIFSAQSQFSRCILRSGYVYAQSTCDIAEESGVREAAPLANHGQQS